jgi:glyoxylase-like metal-dependent hydrolase (beta-lactamase superfamily II)
VSGLVVATALWLAGPLRADDPYRLAFESVTDDVVLVYRPDMARYPVVGNAVILFNRGSVILVDGGGGAAVPDQIVAKIRDRTDDPLSHIILTHWHSDHTVGLDRYRSHFPEVKIVAHPFTRERIASALAERVGGFGERVRSLVKEAEQQLATGLSNNGEPMSAAERSYKQQIIEDRDALFRQADAASVAVPDTLVEDRLTLDAVNRTIEVHFLGRANSPGDLVIFLPGEKLMIGGDIITHPVPFGYPKYPHELVESIDRLLTFDFELLLPGHGRVLQGKSYARKVRELVHRTNTRIDELVARGMTLDEIREAVDFSAESRRFAAGDERIAYFFSKWYATPVVERTFNEATDRVD